MPSPSGRHLSRLIERALAGEEVIVAKSGKPLVRITPIAPKEAGVGERSRDGHLQEGWDDPMTEAELPNGKAERSSRIEATPRYSHVPVGVWQPQLMTPSMRGLLEESAVERWVSVVALIEIAVQAQKGKLELPLHREYFLDQITALRAKSLPIEAEHCFTMFSLPRHHGDPFDRLLIS